MQCAAVRKGMNRMKATRDSTAYEHFEDSTTSTAGQKQKQSKPRRKIKRDLSPGLIAGVIISAIAAGYIIVCQMQLTQLTAEISSKNEKLDQIIADNISYSSKQVYDKELDKVEEIAVDRLGMMKMDAGQIEYVELTGQDTIIVSNPELTLGRIFEIVKDKILWIVEYIR